MMLLKNEPWYDVELYWQVLQRDHLTFSVSRIPGIQTLQNKNVGEKLYADYFKFYNFITQLIILYFGCTNKMLGVFRCDERGVTATLFIVERNRMHVFYRYNGHRYDIFLQQPLSECEFYTVKNWILAFWAHIWSKDNDSTLNGL